MHTVSAGTYPWIPPCFYFAAPESPHRARRWGSRWKTRWLQCGSRLSSTLGLVAAGALLGHKIFHADDHTPALRCASHRTLDRQQALACIHRQLIRLACTGCRAALPRLARRRRGCTQASRLHSGNRTGHIRAAWSC
jgi:hypothetical protein